MKTIYTQFSRPTALWLALSILLLASIVQAQQAESTATDFEMPAPIRSAEDIALLAPFTFVRIEYSGHTDRVRGGWTTDYPGADQAFSSHFQRLTGLATNLGGLTLQLTDPALQQYPFIYIVEAGQMSLSDAEALALRDYLLGGGFLMVDDFWGETEWEWFTTEFRRAFPDREPVELPADHEILRSFYDVSETLQRIGRDTAQATIAPHLWGGY